MLSVWDRSVLLQNFASRVLLSTHIYLSKMKTYEFMLRTDFMKEAFQHSCQATFNMCVAFLQSPFQLAFSLDLFH